MKKFVYIVLSLVLLTGCTGEKEVTEEQNVKEEQVVTSLQDRNGLMYELNTEVGFTGVFVEKYDNGQKKTENHYKDGKLDGFSTEWRENG
jgi:antitoxin component YwqK of YwqJK toxin-antitoxin module